MGAVAVQSRKCRQEGVYTFSAVSSRSMSQAAAGSTTHNVGVSLYGKVFATSVVLTFYTAALAKLYYNAIRIERSAEACEGSRFRGSTTRTRLQTT